MADELSANYAPPGMRWGIFLADYPNATYRFETKVGTELDPPVPAEFGGDGLFVVAVIDRQDGTEPVTGYKDVPETVERWQGNSGHRSKVTVPFERTPDNWQVLCTKALGRALKRAGYPDSTADLKAVLLWRQRLVEIDAMRRGVRLEPVAFGSPARQALPAGSDDLDKAGGADRHADREVDPEDPDANGVIDVTSVPVDLIQWDKEALDEVADLPEQVQKEIFELAIARGIDVGKPAERRVTLMALIKSKKDAYIAATAA